MARLYPPQPPGSAPSSERMVFERLAGLDDDWLVFHSVAWQGIRHGRQGDGEADFVLAHPHKGLLVVEVKGGRIRIENGQWVSVDRHGRAHRLRNPFEQAVDSKYALRDHLDERVPRSHGRIRLGHAVAFPNVEVEDDLAANAPRPIIWDRTDLADVSRAVDRTAAHWKGLTAFDDGQVAAIRQALAPVREVRPLLRHRVEDAGRALLELTTQQTQLLQFLRRQRRALVTGGAGTGKTVLAAERARQLAAQGHRVLLVCYNAPLGAKLAADLADVEGVTAGHFHQLANRLVGDAGMLPAGDRDATWWSTTLPGVLPDAADRLGVEFDAVVVDEGQDFEPTWWVALELLLSDPDDGFFYVFADAQQDLYRVGWAAPFAGEPFELDVNCRNTLPIAARVNAVFGRADPSLGAEGPPPVFVEATTPTQVAKRLRRLIERLLTDDGLAAEQIAILSTERKMVDELRGQRIGAHRLTPPDQGGVAVETVYRFKGLEADAVVVVLPRLSSAEDRVLAYVGMSRARALLFVIGPPIVKEALSWP